LLGVTEVRKKISKALMTNRSKLRVGKHEKGKQFLENRGRKVRK